MFFRSFFACLAVLAVSADLAAKPGRGGTGGGGGDGGGSVTSPGNKIVANPADYFLPIDLELEDELGDPVNYSAGTRWYQVPDVEKLRAELAAGLYNNDDEARIAKARIVAGYDIMNQTYQKIGLARTDGNDPLYFGRVMNCSTCHAQAGTVPFAWPLFRTATRFGNRPTQADPVNQGEPYGFLGYWRDTTTVNRDCGLNCAGQGHLPVGSEEMESLNAWVLAVSEGIYANEGILLPELRLEANLSVLENTLGSRLPAFPEVLGDANFRADPARGKRIYDRNCASCHGKDGLGKWTDTGGYSNPPVAGPASYAKAGGPYMTPVLAAFIKRQMPLAKPGSLTNQEAIDVAAYINDLPRESRWWQEYYHDHNPCKRAAFLPLEVGVVPVGFGFTAAQVKYGPWKPIKAWLDSAECLDNNPTSTPKIPEDFDTGYDGMGNFMNPGYPSPRD